MMQRLRDTVCDSTLTLFKERIVHYIDHFLFRNHYVWIAAI
jgi:hypothetical protein